MLSIRDAARQTGVSRSAIFRAIKTGKISAPRRENGDYAIDPSELFRVFDPRSTGEGEGRETWANPVS
jgi:excisionase family DNA binding protein